MKYVLDASVALNWVLTESDSERAIRLRDNARLFVDQIISPDLFPAECGHAIFRAERKKLLTAIEARRCLATILLDCPELHATLSLLPRAAAICQQWQTGFYDAIYIALAEREQINFVTADLKLVKKVSADLPFVVILDALP